MSTASIGLPSGEAGSPRPPFTPRQIGDAILTLAIAALLGLFLAAGILVAVAYRNAPSAPVFRYPEPTTPGPRVIPAPASCSCGSRGSSVGCLCGTERQTPAKPFQIRCLYCQSYFWVQPPKESGTGQRGDVVGAIVAPKPK